MTLVILDRDGVINHDSHEYIKSPDEWQAIPGSLEAIARLNQAGFKVVIATNQSGIARGYYDLATLEKIHEKLKRECYALGGEIADIFFCPHHPDDNCMCRKPKPGLFNQIRDKYTVNLAEVFYIGDSATDIQVANVVGCKPILVLTGNGHKTLSALSVQPPHFPDLAHAAEYIIYEN